MKVTINRDDIITIGEYDKQISKDEYSDGSITIPISSILDKTGQTKITIKIFTTNEVEFTSTIYYNVF